MKLTTPTAVVSRDFLGHFTNLLQIKIHIRCHKQLNQNSRSLIKYDNTLDQ